MKDFWAGVLISVAILVFATMVFCMFTVDKNRKIKCVMDLQSNQRLTALEVKALCE